MNNAKSFYDDLPKKRMAAGCLILNASSQILLVKPTYKDVWEIPGGIVEENESPKECCAREIAEEIGLNLEVGRLLLVDYNSANELKTESLMFVFTANKLSDAQINSIKLQESELSEFRFFDVSELPEQLTNSLKTRILRACNLAKTNGTAYYENKASS